MPNVDVFYLNKFSSYDAPRMVFLEGSVLVDTNDAPFNRETTTQPS